MKTDLKAICHLQIPNFTVRTGKHWLNIGDGFLDWLKESQTTLAETISLRYLNKTIKERDMLG